MPWARLWRKMMANSWATLLFCRVIGWAEFRMLIVVVPTTKVTADQLSGSTSIS
jgi:hypothetical protein